MTRLQALKILEQRHQDVFLHGQAPTKERLARIKELWRRIPQDIIEQGCQDVITKGWKPTVTAKEVWESLGSD